MISGKIKTEVKHFKTESSKHLSESLTWYKKQINFLKNKCKSKYMITAKLSKTIENLKSKNTQVISWDVQTNSYPPTKEPPFRDIM